MRKTILSFLFLAGCISLQAQDNAILGNIEKANSAIKTIEGSFVQTKKTLAKEEAQQSEGNLYVMGSDKMALHYKEPSTDLLIINASDFYLVRGKKKNRFDTEKNATMRNLSNTLLHCIHGKPQLLMKENEAEIAVKKENNGYLVTLTTEKKKVKGYAKIVLRYDLKSMVLTYMQMEEFNGNSTTYEMKGIKTNTTFDASVFDIPKN